MATKLDKDIIRESTILRENREIVVTLTSKQTISLKLKGMKSGEVSIDIGELFDNLNGVDNEIKKPKSVVIKHDKDSKKQVPLISLTDLRTYNAISGLDYPTLCKFENIIKNLMDNYPETYGKYINNDKLKE